MGNQNKTKDFLSEAKNISLGYNEINFVNPDDLDKAQIGYRVDPSGNDLTSTDEGGWQEGWILIANDDLADPIIADTDSLNLTIMTSAHGEGSWDPQVIAEGLDDFKYILSLLENAAVKRSDAVNSEENLLSEYEKEALLLKIEERNPDIAIWYWANFLGLEIA